MSAIFDAYESELLMLLSQISQLCETHLKRAGENNEEFSANFHDLVY